MPKKVFIVCYYDLRAMALVAAANKLGIETVEMQHGPQTDLQLAYGSWFNMPVNGFQVMPRNFWCWDSDSKNKIECWAKYKSGFSAFVGGNPWMDFWNTNQAGFKSNTYILYSLQPSPVTLEQMFTAGLLNTIKNSPVEWFIRLHPRQLEQLEKIKTFLKHKEIYNLVKIEDATRLPLPILLSNTMLHVTNFSGTTIESGLYGVHTVLLSKTGRDYFPDMIKNGMASYIDGYSETFESDFRKLFYSKKKDTLSESKIIDKSHVFK